MSDDYRRHFGILLTLFQSNSKDLASWSENCAAITSDVQQLTADVSAGRWAGQEAQIASDLLDRLLDEKDAWRLCRYSENAAMASHSVAELLSPISSPMTPNERKVIFGVKAMDAVLGLKTR